MKGREKMKLGVIWWLALVIAMVGVLMHQGIVSIAGLTGYTFWMEVVAWGLLAVKSLMKK